MKKAVKWIIISLIVLIGIPAAFVVMYGKSRWKRDIIYYLINPLFFMVLGISSGRYIKKHWFLPVIAAVIFVIEEIISFKKRFMGDITLLAVSYIVIAVIAMAMTAIVCRMEKKPDLIGIVIKSLLITAIINGGGFLINLLGYYCTGDILLGYTSWGGDYSGKSGFGLVANRVYPMTSEDDPGPSRTDWLSFQPLTFIMSCLVVFTVLFVIMLIADILKHGRFSANADKSV